MSEPTSTRPKFHTRPAEPSDIPTILSFILELAIYEHEEDKAKATAADLHEALFAPGHVANALIAQLEEGEKKEVGFALYFYNFSTWIGRKGLYLEDLYVSPVHRSLGAGRALFSHLASIAEREKCGRMEWSCLKWNEPSLQFYDKVVGAQRMEGWVGLRVEGAAGFERVKNLASCTRMN